MRLDDWPPSDGQVAVIALLATVVAAVVAAVVALATAGVMWLAG